MLHYVQQWSAVWTCRCMRQSRERNFSSQKQRVETIRCSRSRKFWPTSPSYQVLKNFLIVLCLTFKQVPFVFLLYLSKEYYKLIQLKIIRQVYSDLVLSGDIIEKEEVPPPTVPMDYSWARVSSLLIIINCILITQ